MPKVEKAKNFDLGLYNESLVLILGAPRSGTTLFAAMLSAHPECCILMEDYYGGAFRILSKKIAGVKLCTPNQITYENSGKKTKLKKGLNFLAKYTLSKLGIKKRFNIPSAFSITDYIDRTKSIKIIYVIRNPVHAIKSESKRNKISLENATQQWDESIAIIKKVQKYEGLKDPVYFVDYDQMVSHPEKTMNGVFEYLDIPYTDAILDGFKYTPQYKGRSGIEVKKEYEIDETTKAQFGLQLNEYFSLIKNN